MADNLATIAFKGLVLLFITGVVVFICFFMVLRVERHVANSQLERRGASRFTPDGEPNFWYFFVRDIPTILELASLPYLEKPTIEHTEKGFVVRGKDYDITYERVRVCDPEDSEAVAEKPKPQSNFDYAMSVIKGKTHYWKRPVEKRTDDVVVPKSKILETLQSAPDNTIPTVDETLKP